jgi:hypothetical protein
MLDSTDNFTNEAFNTKFPRSVFSCFGDRIVNAQTGLPSEKMNSKTLEL